ncbi:prephenate dehydratase [Fictibacillus terranigra]|uniref:Prephenate dehydratase n=1 Tax=Fictibacillus terranigra TaxID=3058424 RepID=A0ABT8EBX0_9BACL|nr:prephenate dehydratase [Fictibacillus sp. CENA-BCM004]MDN4075396.1 prephenate dehydratase [Fictibacillus sp. CENA-BCM004]
MNVGKAGYLGPKATFTHLAVQAVLPGEEHIPYATIPACIDAVEHKELDFGLVPLENAFEGTVNLTLDYLIHEKRLPIVGEIVTPIRQHLMVHPQHADQCEELEKIYSHSHAIAQCHKFFRSHFSSVPLEGVISTAFAAQHVQQHPERLIGAIANEFAAKEYGLKIVHENVHDYNHNTTRFIMISREAHDIPVSNQVIEHYKTTLMVTLPSDQAGALHQVLAAFSWRKLNLSKIESRPMKTGLGNYFFIIDINQRLDDILIPGAIAELESLGCTVHILGSYPCFAVKTAETCQVPQMTY